MAEKTKQNPMNTSGDMELHDDEMFSQNFLETPEESGGSQPKRPRLIYTSCPIYTALCLLGMIFVATIWDFWNSLHCAIHAIHLHEIF